MYVPTTLKVIIRPDKPNAKGLAPILLRFTQNRKKHTIALKKRVKPENWINANGMYVRESGKDAPRNGKVINVFIRSFMARAENILLEAQMQNQSVSFSEFKAKIVNSNNQDFLKFFDEEIQRRTQANFAETSITTYQSEYNKLKLYKHRIDFVDLTPAFLEAYQDYLTEELGNKQNTVFRAMKTIKTILNVARKKKITDVYPFVNFKFHYEKDTRAQLNLTELEQLQSYHDEQKLPKHLQNVLKHFLFACYTGLSFSDLEALDYSCIYENGGEFFIRGKRKKTNSAFLVPLLKNAKKLIDISQKEGLVFPNMITNQKSNISLKKIASLSNIKKHMTFHVSRHTFGTVALNHGIPQEVVQKMMGHSTSDMTSNYAKVLDGYVMREMKKWEQVETSKKTDNYQEDLSEKSLAVYKKLRIQIIATRIANGISEIDVAGRLKVSEEAYKALEQGKTEIGVGQLLVLGEYFRVDFLSL